MIYAFKLMTSQNLKNSWGEQEGDYIVRYHFSVLDIIIKHILEKLSYTPSNFFLWCISFVLKICL